MDEARKSYRERQREARAAARAKQLNKVRQPRQARPALASAGQTSSD
jgi:hypothetical protein